MASFKAEEPKKKPEEKIPETEVSETRYMGEGPPGRTGEGTEIDETAYMGEPEERNESKHDTEYNKDRSGMPRVGKATRSAHKKGEEKKPA